MKAAFGYRVIVSLRRVLARMLESLPPGSKLERPVVVVTSLRLLANICHVL